MIMQLVVKPYNLFLIVTTFMWPSHAIPQIEMNEHNIPFHLHFLKRFSSNSKRHQLVKYWATIAGDMGGSKKMHIQFVKINFFQLFEASKAHQEEISFDCNLCFPKNWQYPIQKPQIIKTSHLFSTSTQSFHQRLFMHIQGILDIL